MSTILFCFLFTQTLHKTSQEQGYAYFTPVYIPSWEMQFLKSEGSFASIRYQLPTHQDASRVTIVRCGNTSFLLQLPSQLCWSQSGFRHLSQNRLPQCFKSQQVACKEITKLPFISPSAHILLFLHRLYFVKRKLLNSFPYYLRGLPLLMWWQLQNWYLVVVFLQLCHVSLRNKAGISEDKKRKTLFQHISAIYIVSTLIFAWMMKTGRPVKQQSICNEILHMASLYMVSTEIWKGPSSARMINTIFRDKMRRNISPVWAAECDNAMQWLTPRLGSFVIQSWSESTWGMTEGRWSVKCWFGLETREGSELWLKMGESWQEAVARGLMWDWGFARGH